MDAGDGFVRFTQTAGGRTGFLVENRTRQAVLPDQLPTTWTTLALAIPSSSEPNLVGANSFPTRAEHTVGREDSPAVVTAVETALERELSLEIMGGAGSEEEAGTAHGRQAARRARSFRHHQSLYRVLDGVLQVVVAGKVIAELGPEAIGASACSWNPDTSGNVRAKVTAKGVPIPAGEVGRRERSMRSPQDIGAKLGRT